MRCSSMYFLGIDTSCYTTSAALLDCEGNVVREDRRLLRVPRGKRGLAQSEMVYQHTRHLPSILDDVIGSDGTQIAAVGVSGMPRRREDSYMPAFLVGAGYAQALSRVLQCSCCLFSHQENHVMAALRTVPEYWGKNGYMLHLSGGTTDWLCLQWESGRLAVEEVAGSEDISAGQLIDRIGVLLGMPFPCGPALEKLAASAEEAPYTLQLPRNPNIISFAGAETELRRRYAQGLLSPAQTAAAVFDYIRRSLRRTLLRRRWDRGTFLIAVGGVMANSYLRTHLAEDAARIGLIPIFAPPEYSADNATGNAYGALRYYDETR